LIFLFVWCNIQSEKSHKSYKKEIKSQKVVAQKKDCVRNRSFEDFFFNNSANHDGAELSSYMSQHPQGGKGGAFTDWGSGGSFLLSHTGHRYIITLHGTELDPPKSLMGNSIQTDSNSFLNSK